MPEREESDRLALSGVMTIRETPSIHQRLRDMLVSRTAVTIDCREVSDIDPSFIQLVLSARKTAAARGKRLSFLSPNVDGLCDTLVRIGLMSASEDPESKERQFWFNEALDSGKDDTDGR